MSAAIGVLIWIVPPGPAEGESTAAHSTARVGSIRNCWAQFRNLCAAHGVYGNVIVLLHAGERAGGAARRAMEVYMPVVLLSFALMMKPLMIAERRALIRPAVHRLNRAGSLGSRVLCCMARRCSGWSVAAGVLHRLQYSGSLSAITGIARSARICERLALGIYNTAQAFGALRRRATRGHGRTALGCRSRVRFAALATAVWCLVAVGMREVPIKGVGSQLR